MDRIHAVSEGSFPRKTRSSSHHGDYVSSSGYPLSLSLYNAVDPKPVSGDGYGLAGSFSDPLSRDGKEGHTEWRSGDGYGGYSYSSSFDDMRRSAHEGRYPYTRQFEDSNPFEASAYGMYDHGSYRGLSSVSCYKSLSSFDGAVAAPGPRSSSLYGDKEQKSGTGHQDLSYLRTADSHQTQYNDLGLNQSNIASVNKPDVLEFEHSAAVRERNAMLQHYSLAYPPKDAALDFQQPFRIREGSLTGAASDYQLLSQKYDSSMSSMLPKFGSLSDWRNAGGTVPDAGRLSMSVQEPYALGRTGNGLSIMDGSLYSNMRELNKFGMGDGGGGKQVQLEIGLKGSLSSLPSSSGNKISDCNEGSQQMGGVDSGRGVTEKKKRQSRWEPVEENEKTGENGTDKKRKKSRWSEEKPPAKEVSLPDILKGGDYDQIALRAQLIIINKKLQSGQVVDDRPEEERSPSPAPVFDNFGYRVNTREFRARERLNKERQRILAKLSEKLPDSNKQAKFSRKLFIPIDKYPDYNFIGLIIGPRGHTQKKMEKESGSKIFIRGKGSAREGSSTLTVLEESENLHVLIEADTEESVNKAVTMVEKLLVPVGDEHNEHKRAQLRELATLNGTLRGSESGLVCKDAWQGAKDCSMADTKAGSSADGVHNGDTSHGNDHCHVCKGKGHLSKDCPLSHAASGSVLKGGSIGSKGLQVTTVDSWLSNNKDNTVLYVAFLPLSVNDTHLRSLFSPFGQVVNAKVMRHLTTGISKSYGFVKFLDAADASQAVALMNGYKLDGKVLLVKLKMNVEIAS